MNDAGEFRDDGGVGPAVRGADADVDARGESVGLDEVRAAGAGEDLDGEEVAGSPRRERSAARR
ncbi:MAG: hypothetical protein IT452_11595 [Planctomycetia bacterium]|nr:hypothetical protein [Planctomycetia bacterium]